MKSCRDIQPMLAAYVDGEASPVDRSAVQAHLDACAPCRDAACGERTARDVVTACRDRLRAAAPDALRARCVASANLLPSSARWRPGWRTVVPLSLAASILLAVGGVFVYSAVNQVEALAAQMAADHAKCLLFESHDPGDHAAEEARWARAHGWPVQAPTSTREHDLEFMTIRQCLVTDGRTAHIMYKWRGQPLSVYVLPKALDAIGQQRITERFGYNATMWSNRGRTYVIVADAQPQEMAPVVSYVRARAR